MKGIPHCCIGRKNEPTLGEENRNIFAGVISKFNHFFYTKIINENKKIYYRIFILSRGFQLKKKKKTL